MIPIVSIVCTMIPVWCARVSQSGSKRRRECYLCRNSDLFLRHALTCHSPTDPPVLPPWARGPLVMAGSEKSPDPPSASSRNPLGSAERLPPLVLSAPGPGGHLAASATPSPHRPPATCPTHWCEKAVFLSENVDGWKDEQLFPSCVTPLLPGPALPKLGPRHRLGRGLQPERRRTPLLGFGGFAESLC